MKQHISLLALLVLLALPLRAQVKAEAVIDPIAIVIGEQATLTVKVTARQGARIDFPAYERAQQIAPGVEVLSSAPGDSTALDGGMMQQTRVYKITAFDECLAAIPPLTVTVNGKPCKTAGAAFKCVIPDVDTLHMDKMFPPKDVQDNPFLWADWAPAFWAALLLALLLIAGAYLLLCLVRNKPVVARIKFVKRVPPHQQALNAIEHIKAERMTGGADQKEYYTRLTDALRQYINGRFGFQATEMTTWEIIDRLQQTGDAAMIDELRRLFDTADLVKFAKHTALISENDQNLLAAIHFIDSTKTDEKPKEEAVQPKLSEEQVRTRNARTALKTTLYVLAAAAAALFALVLWQLYELLL